MDQPVMSGQNYHAGSPGGNPWVGQVL